MRMQDLINSSNIPASLVRATVRQAGGWESFKEMAEDVANHGADAGFSGFTYYTDTLAFYARQRSNIVAYAESYAYDLGENVLIMVRNFRCIGEDYSFSEIISTLYGSKSKHDTQISNCMAWFALEEVCRMYVDMMKKFTLYKYAEWAIVEEINRLMVKIPTMQFNIGNPPEVWERMIKEYELEVANHIQKLRVKQKHYAETRGLYLSELDNQ